MRVIRHQPLQQSFQPIIVATSTPSQMPPSHHALLRLIFSRQGRLNVPESSGCPVCCVLWPIKLSCSRRRLSLIEHHFRPALNPVPHNPHSHVGLVPFRVHYPSLVPRVQSCHLMCSASAGLRPRHHIRSSLSEAPYEAYGMRPILPPHDAEVVCFVQMCCTCSAPFQLIREVGTLRTAAELIDGFQPGLCQPPRAGGIVSPSKISFPDL